MAGVFHQCGQSICKRTRDEMDDRARIIARALAEQGVCDNDVVAIFMRNHVDIFEIVEACRYVGSRYVLLNWHSPVAELLPILDDCGAKALFAHRDLLKGENAHETLLQVPTLSVIYTIKTPESILERYHLTDNSLLASEAKTGEQYQCLDTLLAAPNATRHDEPPKRFKGMFPYTSGSTGKPKGIKRDEDLTRPDPYLIFKGLSEALMQLSIGDRFFVSAPLYHSAPHAVTLCCLAAGNIDVYIEPQFDPERFLQDIERFKLTHAYIVPTMMVRLLKLPESIRSKYDTS
ncbi:MAG: AMP-binding protein, partial [Pseudomonadota bacterium]|nr:AMP-binding protein [Pseudomonadota bacterium]